MNKLVLFALLMAGIFSCSKDNDFRGFENSTPEGKKLRIVTRTLSAKMPDFIQEFTDGSVIGLHVTDGTIGSLYHGNINYKNVKAQAIFKKDKRDWQQTPVISVDSEAATVYAYYPYQSQADFDVTRIPIRISPDATRTDDYMYGTQATGQKTVNRISPIVLLNMNHALSLISFEVSLKKDRGIYKLNAVQVGNKAGGTVLAAQGTMHIQTGDITPKAGINASTRLELAQPVILDRTPGTTFQLKVIPTSRPIAEGDIEALFAINGKTYIFPVPAKTIWEKGTNYLYKLSFDGYKLELKEVTITNWTQGNREDAISSIM